MGQILGIDPGGKTGVAVYDLESLTVTYHDEIFGSTEGFVEWWNDVNFIVSECEHKVCESFQLDDRTVRPDLTPGEIIGYLKGIGFLKEKAYIDKFQTPAQAKALITNAVLKRAGLYPKRGEVRGGHSTDALRQALYYAVTTLKHKPTVEKLWPKEQEA